MATKGIGKQGCSAGSVGCLELPQGQREGLRQILVVDQEAECTQSL